MMIMFRSNPLVFFGNVSFVEQDVECVRCVSSRCRGVIRLSANGQTARGPTVPRRVVSTESTIKS